jgi:hypothetical protein
MAKELRIKIDLTREEFRECLISALEENVHAQTYFSDVMRKIRAAQKAHETKQKKEKK